MRSLFQVLQCIYRPIRALKVPQNVQKSCETGLGSWSRWFRKNTDWAPWRASWLMTVCPSWSWSTRSSLCSGWLTLSCRGGCDRCGWTYWLEIHLWGVRGSSPYMDLCIRGEQLSFHLLLFQQYHRQLLPCLIIFYINIWICIYHLYIYVVWLISYSTKRLGSWNLRILRI